MKRPHVFSTCLLLALLIGASVASAQGPTPIAPGASMTVSCTTTMTMTMIDGHTLTLSCAAGPAAPTPTRTALPVATATALPSATQTPAPPPTGGSGIWTSATELATKPMSGPAWAAVKAAADGSLGSPNISDQDSKHDTSTLAVALVYARTGTTSYRAKAANAILSAIGTEAGGRTLALGRNLVSYVIAADLIGLSTYDPAGDQRFRAWLSSVRRATLDGRTLISTHEDRPNNWGTHAGASRIAADLYLGDTADLARAWTVYRGYVGNRAAYAGFKYGDLSWQCSSSAPVGINGPCTRDGHNLDGAIPDDMRRGGSYRWPPSGTGYPWEAMQGLVVQAVLLNRAGYPALTEQNQAVLRAARFLDRLGWAAEGDDTWIPALLNASYGTSYAVSGGVGKNMGWTNFSHGR